MLQQFVLVLMWGPLFVRDPCSAEHAEHA